MNTRFASRKREPCPLSARFASCLPATSATIPTDRPIRMALPNAMHAEHAVRAADAHVLCENGNGGLCRPSSACASTQADTLLLTQQHRQPRPGNAA